MQLIIQNKLISLRGSSTIQDENGKSVFQVKGKLFSITRKKFICDLEGNCLFIVRNQFWRLFTHKAFVLDSSNHQVAYVKRRWWSLGRNKFLVSGLAEDEIRIDGSFFEWNYSIIKNEQEIATVHRNLTFAKDKFTLNVKNDADAAFLVAMVIAIDNIVDNEQRN